MGKRKSRKKKSLPLTPARPKADLMSLKKIGERIDNLGRRMIEVETRLNYSPRRRMRAGIATKPSEGLKSPSARKNVQEEEGETVYVLDSELKLLDEIPPGQRFLFPELLDPLFTQDAIEPVKLGSKRFSKMTASQFEDWVKSELQVFEVLEVEEEKAAMGGCCLLLASVAQEEALAHKAYNILADNNYWEFGNSHFETILRNWGLRCQWETATEEYGGEGSSAPEYHNVKLVYQAMTHCVSRLGPLQLRRMHSRTVHLALDPLLGYQTHLTASFLVAAQRKLLSLQHFTVEDLSKDFSDFGVDNAVLSCLAVAPKTAMGRRIAGIAACSVVCRTLGQPFAPPKGKITFEYLSDTVVTAGEVFIDLPSHAAYHCLTLIDFVMSTIDTEEDSVQAAVGRLLNVVRCKMRCSSKQVVTYLSHVTVQMERYNIGYRPFLTSP